MDANDLNTFYCRFDTIPNPPRTTRDKTNNTTAPPEFTQDSVSRVLKICKRKKAPGPDGLSGELLSLCHQQLAKPFHRIFQRSVDEQTIPTKWKTSAIIPVAKKPNPSQLNDFRPIALTSVAMKCLEKIMKSELLTFAYNKNFIDKFQFAYQHNLGVEDALLTTINLISNHLDSSSNNFCRILYVDFSSAFNAMNTTILLDKLHTLNFPEYLIKWYQSFLIERPQYVKLGAQVSETKVLSNGCPQGCVSSPLLYILYTNDCVATQENCTIIKYADDTAILGLLKDQKSEENYKTEIVTFTEWCLKNHLELNVAKTKEQVFDFRREKSVATRKKTITLNSQPVEIVQSFKYLGVTIDEDLRFKTHINNTIKKCNQRLHILRKLNSFKVKTTTLTHIYKALVLSIMTFGITIWHSGCGVKERAKLQRTIKEASNIINRKL